MGTPPTQQIPLADFLPTLPHIRMVEEKVDPHLGISRELLRTPNEAVWFRGFRNPSVVGNLWPTRESVAQCYGATPAELTEILLSAIEHPVAPALGATRVSWREQETKSGLGSWPVPHFFPRDAGPYLTAAVYSATWKGKRNLSYHRLWVRGDSGGPMRLVPRHLDRMVREARNARVELPVALILGAPIDVLLAAACSTDYAVDEMEIASALHQRRTGSPLSVFELPNGIRVPAQAEIILEGRITLRDEEEGPFLDILGTYDARRVQPVVQIDTVHTVKSPVLHAILPGSNEHFLLMGLPREPLILRAVRSVVPGVKCVRLTEGGCGWLNGVVSIEKRREGDGKNAIMAAFSGHFSMKHVTVVDADIDVFNDREVEWAVATRLQADKGLIVVPGATGSSLDPSATKEGVTTKWGIDATLPVNAPREPFEKGHL